MMLRGTERHYYACTLDMKGGMVGTGAVGIMVCFFIGVSTPQGLKKPRADGVV